MNVTAGPSQFDRPAPSHRHRPPRDCPVCNNRLDVTQLGCPSCGTGLSGRFQSCEFCGLDNADREVLRVFLASRGNMKELERHLGVSYPTARARFDDLLRKLDLGAGPETGPGGSETGTGRSETGTGRSETGRSPAAQERIESVTPLGKADGPGSPGRPDPRLDTLRALAGGELDVDAARRRLTEGPGQDV